MRLSEVMDKVFRQGHLSESALIDAIVAGERPHHLDRCDICAERGVEIARWMNQVQADAADMADELYTPERLSAQQGQIMRRLEQIDSPARVIAFPAGSRPETSTFGRRRVAASWVGVAAAAGLILGVVGGQVSARLSQPAPAPLTANAESAALAEGAGGPVDASLLADPFDRVSLTSLEALEEMTPRLTARSGG